jgi:hypothetical protein
VAVEHLLARVGLVEHDDLLVGRVDADAAGGRTSRVSLP